MAMCAEHVKSVGAMAFGGVDSGCAGVFGYGVAGSVLGVWDPGFGRVG